MTRPSDALAAVQDGLLDLWDWCLSIVGSRGRAAAVGGAVLVVVLAVTALMAASTQPEREPDSPARGEAPTTTAVDTGAPVLDPGQFGRPGR